MKRKWKGLTPALHPASASRKLNQNLLQDQVVKTVTAAFQEGSETNEEEASSNGKAFGDGEGSDGRSSDSEDSSSNGEIAYAADPEEDHDREAKGSSSKADESVPAPQKVMVRFQPEWPNWQKKPKEAHQ